jgi:O-antigen/teichoic acid export membrane protein
VAEGIAGAETRRYGKAAGLLSLGVGISGSITYLYFALASHNLEPNDYGELVVLWSAVFITVSTLYRPVEQLLSRTLAERGARAESFREPLRVAATIQLGLALAFAAAALLLRGPLEDELLSGNETLYWVLIGAVLAYSAGYFARGYFAGTGNLGLYAGLLLFEAVARVCFALAVAVGIAEGQSALALGIVFAPALSLLVLPYALAHGVGRRGGGKGPAESPSATATAPRSTAAAEFTLARGGGFAVAVLVIMLSEQTFLNAGVLIVNGSAGAAAAGFIFNVLMIARAPLVLFQAVATSLLPHLTRLRSTGSPGAPGREAEDAPLEDVGEEAFRLSVRMTVLIVAGFTAAVALIVLAVGPELMQIAFGEKFTYDRAGLLIVTAGMGFYLTAVTLNQAALASGQVRRAALCFATSAAAFVIWSLLPVLEDEFRRIEVGYAGAAALLCGLLYLLYRRPRPREGDVLEPGSPQELEARLAAADEAG